MSNTARVWKKKERRPSFCRTLLDDGDGTDTKSARGREFDPSNSERGMVKFPQLGNWNSPSLSLWGRRRKRGRRRRTDALLLDFLAAFLADFVRFPMSIYRVIFNMRGRFVTLLLLCARLVFLFLYFF